MRYRDAKKLHKGDQVIIKGTKTGSEKYSERIETVSYIEDAGFTIFIFTCEGSDYSHTEVA
jgi:predicted TIM-barrel enzyme